MGEAKRKRAAASGRLAAASGSILPRTYYDLVAQPSDSLWSHVLEDIKRARAEGKSLDQMIPPHGDGKGEAEWAAKAIRANTQADPRFAAQFQQWDIATRLRWAETFTRAYRAILGYEHCGRATYFVHESLSEALAYTQLNRACDQLRLPLEGMAIVFHDDLAREAFDAIAPRSAKAQSAGAITVFLRTDELADIGCRRLLIHSQQTFETGVIGVAVGRYLALRDDWELERSLRTDWSTDGPSGPSGRDAAVMKPATRDDDDDPLIKPADMEQFFDEGVMFARMVVNAVLYISSKHALKADRVDGSYAGASPGPGGQRKYTVLGEGSAQLFSMVDRSQGDDREASSNKTGRRLTVRYLQAGFWRRPPGTSTTHPKDVWVSPHYRGPDDADTLHRARIVR